MLDQTQLKYIELDKNELSSKQVQDYFNRMCDYFIPPINQVIDISVYSDKLVQNADCFFIQNGEENVGFLAIYTNDCSGKVSFISSISVIPRYQGTGVSQKLIDFSVEHAGKKGMKYIKLEVNKNNIRAIKFYKSNKFTIELTDNNSLLMIRDV
jgi:ribosomal protein S18 acetylase RimI-like enzyme